MPKKANLLLIGLIILLILELGFTFGYLKFYEPYRKAHSTMPENGNMVLVQDDSGTLTLSWPKGFHHDRYLVQFLQNDTVIHEEWVREEQMVLPQLPQTELLTIRIRTARGYQIPFVKREQLRMGTGTLSAEVLLQSPGICDLTATADPHSGTVTFSYTLTPQTQCQMHYLENSGNWILLDTLDQPQSTVSLGEGSPFDIPHTGEKLTFSFNACRIYPGLIYYGTDSEQISVIREDMLNRDLALKCTELDDHVFCFTWAETKGDHYLVQLHQAETDSWETVYRVEADQKRSYTTEPLPRCNEYRYRVVAVGGQVMEGSEFAAISGVKTVTTNASPKYCTIWPSQDLEVYQDATKSQSIGTAKGAKAFCVLGLEEGMFRIRYGNGYGYIDSNYCLINLPELLGDLCLYNITNSTQSLYMAHEYEIPSVTGTVILGYENIQLSTGEQLVPLLYPVALRLEKAAYTALEQGYMLKIYDAYRPQDATIALYDQAIALMDQPIPEETYTGKVLDDLHLLTPPSQGEPPPEHSGETEPEPPEGTEPTPPNQDETLVETPEESVLTYGDLMTDYGRYTMNYFLAAGKSRHNKGIALDLTLTDIVTGQDLPMQTSMHDLSWYSELDRNNFNAQTLAAIMESAGFSGLKSEWWHFNDLVAQYSLLPPYQRSGVSAECWMADDLGWRFRLADGSYLVSCTVQIEGISYTFDSNGYLVQ